MLKLQGFARERQRRVSPVLLERSISRRRGGTVFCVVRTKSDVQKDAEAEYGKRHSEADCQE